MQCERGARQGDPILVYIFTLTLEVLSFLVRNNKDIKGLNIFDHLFVNTAYADDTFFLKNKELIEELVETFALFSSSSGFKPLISKREICVLGPLKGVEIQILGIKILGIYFLYNMNHMNQNNYCQAITNNHSILKLWRMRNLSSKGKIAVFKTPAYLALLTVIPNRYY